MKHVKLYEEYQIDEGLKDWLAKAGKVIGAAIALPKMMQYLGFAASAIGKKTDSPEMKSAAEFLFKNGKTLEDKYQDAIAAAVGPLIKDPSKKESIAKDLLYAVTAKHAGKLMSSDPQANYKSQMATDRILSSLNKGDLIDDAKKMLPKFN